MSFSIAATLDEALDSLDQGATPVAGGTDLVVGGRQGKVPLPDNLVAIDRLEGLKGIAEDGASLRIGALATHAVLMENSLVVDGYTALADAAALVGSPSTRNVGTLGGNVMNASPAMDTGAPLVVLGASVELRSVDGTELVPLSDLWVGPGQTSAARNQLCTALLLPAPPERSGSAYVRLEYRRAMEIAVVGAAASVVLNTDDSISTVRVALCAVAPTIVEVEGLHNTTDLAEIAAAASEQATPISDLRASDRYRRHAVGVMARRAVDAAVRRAAGESLSVPINRAIGIGAAS